MKSIGRDLYMGPGAGFAQFAIEPPGNGSLVRATTRVATRIAQQVLTWWDSWTFVSPILSSLGCVATQDCVLGCANCSRPVECLELVDFPTLGLVTACESSALDSSQALW